ncbi:oligosaccaryltransferase, partial [Colletotrichum navitas]
SSGRKLQCGLVVRLAQHHRPHPKLHVRRPDKYKCTKVSFHFLFLTCGFNIGRTQSRKLSTYHDAHSNCYCTDSPKPIMISDNDLYRLAIFLGSAAMVLIILYHYVEVNREEEQPAKPVQPAKSAKAVP